MGGVLETLDDKPLPGEIVSLNVQLIEAATSSASDSGSSASDLQEVLDWNPTVDYYVFSDSEIQNMAAVIKDSYIDNKVIRSVNMRTVSGSIYRVPLDWCKSIWFARNEYFEEDDLDNGLGNGKYNETLKVHQYATTLSDYKKIMKETVYDEVTDKTWYKYQQLSYYTCWFYLLLQETRKYILDTYNIKSFDGIMDVVSSWDSQQLDDDGAGALSSISEYLYNYVSENVFLLQICDKDGNLYPGNLPKIKTLFGFDVQWVKATWENVKKYTNNNQRILVIAQANKLGYAYKDKDNHTGHVICITSCWTGTDKEGNTQQMVYVNDTNSYDFCPNNAYLKDSTDTSEIYKDRIIPWSQLLNAIDSVKLKNDSTMYSSARIHSSYDYKTFCVISLNSSQRTPTLIREAITDTTFNPNGMKYEFTAEEIKKTYLERQKWQYDNKGKDVDTATFTMKDRYGNQWNMNGAWVDSICYAYAYTYITNPYVNQTNKTITVDKNSTSQWYYNTRNTDYGWWGDYRLTKEVTQQITNNPEIILSSCEICWNLGVFYTLKEMDTIVTEYKTKVGDITPNTPLTIAVIKYVQYALNKKNITIYTKEFTKPNKETLKKYAWYSGIASMWVLKINNYDGLLYANYITDVLTSPDNGGFLILLNGVTNDTAYYFVPYLKGNGPNYYQSTRIQDVTDTQVSKLGLFPYWNAPMDNFILRINNEYNDTGVNPVVYFSLTPFTE